TGGTLALGASRIWGGGDLDASFRNRQSSVAQREVAAQLAVFEKWRGPASFLRTPLRFSFERSGGMGNPLFCRRNGVSLARKTVAVAGLGVRTGTLYNRVLCDVGLARYLAAQHS